MVNRLLDARAEDAIYNRILLQRWIDLSERLLHCREAAVAAREVSAGEAAGGCGDGSQCEERPPVDGALLQQNLRGLPPAFLL